MLRGRPDDPGDGEVEEVKVIYTSDVGWVMTQPTFLFEIIAGDKVFFGIP